VWIARVATKNNKAVATELNSYQLDIKEIHNFVQDLKAEHDLYKSQKKGPAVWVMNFSLYGPIDEDLLNYYVALPSKDLLYVAAAGNGPDPPSTVSSSLYPRYDDGLSNVLVVGALDGEHQLAGYSNHDSKYVDMFAQGSCVCGDALRVNGRNPDTANQLNGTSQAAPIVATAAKLVADKFKAWTPQEVKWRLISTTDYVDTLRKFGKGGELNLPRALNNVFNQTLIVKSDGKDNSVGHIDASTAPIWKELLPPGEHGPILRLHQRATCERQEKTCKDGDTCWDTMHYGDGFDGTVRVCSSTKLPYTENGGKTDGSIAAKDLKELIQPIQAN
jgi:hypothetical protein